MDAHRDDGKRFIGRDDEKLIACNGIGRISDRTNYESGRNMSARDMVAATEHGDMNTT